MDSFGCAIVTVVKRMKVNKNIFFMGCYGLIVTMPQSNWKTCPDRDAAFSDIKNTAISVTSWGFKIFLRGWRSVKLSTILSLRNNLEANSVSVTVGAMAFILIFGANSAAKDFTKPSTPALAVAIDAWKGMPNFTATVLKRTMAGCCPFFRIGMYF